MSCESHFKGTDPAPVSLHLYMKQAKESSGDVQKWELHDSNSEFASREAQQQSTLLQACSTLENKRCYSLKG